MILTNLVLGENIVPEFIQSECTPDKLAASLAPLLRESPQRQKQIEALAKLDQIMEISSAQPARKAADIVLQVARKAVTPT